MKQRLKKILSAMIVACMMVSLLPTAFALDISSEETGSCDYGEIGAVKVYDGGTVEVGPTWNTFILTAPSAEYMAEKQPGKTFVCWVDGSVFGNEKVYVPDTLYWHLNTGVVLRLYAKYSDDNSDQYYLVNYHNPDGTLYDTELGVVGETVALSTDFPTTAEAQWYTDPECTTEASDITGESGVTYCLYSKEKMYQIVTGNWSNNATINLVTPSEPQAAAGTQVNFTVEPSEGFKVDPSAVSVLYVDEEGNDCSVVVTQNTDGSYSFTMPAADVSINAVAAQYAVTAIGAANRGEVTVDPGVAEAGGKITITADPNDGYRVKHVKAVDADGNSVPVSFVQEDANYVETWSFTMPANDVEVTVYFELQGSSYYTDVRTDAWYYHSVTFVSDRGYFKGVTPTLFGPEIPMDRAMFVTVLGRIYGVDEDASVDTTFEDVDTARYYAPYVAWAQENGIVNGTSETTFEPAAEITREQMTAIMYRYCDYIGLDMTNPNPQFMDRYTDTDEISAYAKSNVEWAVGVGLIKGMSETTIDPQGTATRAQVAQVIMNFSDKVLYQ